MEKNTAYGLLFFSIFLYYHFVFESIQLNPNRTCKIGQKKKRKMKAGDLAGAIKNIGKSIAGQRNQILKKVPESGR